MPMPKPFANDPWLPVFFWSICTSISQKFWLWLEGHTQKASTCLMLLAYEQRYTINSNIWLAIHVTWTNRQRWKATNSLVGTMETHEGAKVQTLYAFGVSSDTKASLVGLKSLLNSTLSSLKHEMIWCKQRNMCRLIKVVSLQHSAGETTDNVQLGQQSWLALQDSVIGSFSSLSWTKTDGKWNATSTSVQFPRQSWKLNQQKKTWIGPNRDNFLW